MVARARLAVLAALSLACVSPTTAQVSEHQRIGVERKTDWELGFELGGAMTGDAYAAVDYLSVDGYASVEVLLARTWTASLYAPVSSRLAVGDGVRRAAAAGLGDLELSAGWAGRRADSRLSAALRVTAPTGEWNGYAATVGVLTPGSGRWSVGATLSAAMLLDPVALGASFAYDVGLPRAERFAMTWRPGDMSLSLSATEVLNDRVGYTVKAAQSASLPELDGGEPSLDSFAYAARASIELWYSDGDAQARFGVSKSLTDPDSPALLYAALSYTLRSERDDA